MNPIVEPEQRMDQAAVSLNTKPPSYNRLQTINLVKQELDATYAKVRQAHKEGGKVVWAVGDLAMSFLISTQGLRMIGLGANSARNASRGGIRQVIPAAESIGCAPEQCSFGKIAIGGAALIAEGRGDEIQPDCRLPRADFALVQTACPVQLYIAHNLQQLYGIPVFELDEPMFYELEWKGGKLEGPEWERNYAYVLKQLKDFIVFLEENMGHPFDWDALRQSLIVAKKTSEIRDRIMQKYGHVMPMPLSQFDLLAAQGMTFIKTSNSAIDFWQRIEKEVAERVQNGLGSVKNEKYRLVWDGYPVYFKVGALSRMFAEYGATILPLGTGGLGAEATRHERIDPDRPLESVARLIIPRDHGEPQEYGVDRLLAEMEEVTPVHGMVFHAPRTCRAEAVHMVHRAELFGEKTGLATLVLNMDQCDPQFYSDAQVQTRVQAFIESLENRNPWMAA